MSDILLKSFFTDEGDLVIQGIGLPFGSPDHRDLHGDFADEQTDTGGLPMVFSYFDHRKSLEWLPEAINPFKEDLVGYAKSVGKTSEGLVYNIVVDRNKKYKHLLKRMADDGALKLSSEVKFREDDPNVPGRLKKWHITAVDLTPTAANPDAEIKAVYEEMAKSISLPEDSITMADEKKQPDPTQNGSGEGAGANETVETLAQKTAKRFENLEKAMPPEMKKKMDEAAAAKEDAADGGKDDDEENADGTKKKLAAEAKGIDMAALANMIETAVQKAVAPVAEQVEAMNKSHKTTEKSVGEIMEAFDVLTENVEKTVKNTIANGAEESKKSNLEKRVEATKQTKPQSEYGSVPASWPGAGK